VEAPSGLAFNGPDVLEGHLEARRAGYDALAAYVRSQPGVTTRSSRFCRGPEAAPAVEGGRWVPAALAIPRLATVLTARNEAGFTRRRCLFA
jgi:hypothetical protein